MTREEALKLFRGATPDPSSLSDEAWIDRFVALGLLQLDKQKTLGTRIRDLMSMPGMAQGGLDERVEFLRWALDYCELEIVEKKP